MPFLTKTNKRKKPEVNEIRSNHECSASHVVTNFKDTNNNSLDKKFKAESFSTNDSKEAAEIRSSPLKEKTVDEILKEKEETLRRLKLVEHYKTKIEIQELDSVIGKWKRVAQRALSELQEYYNNTCSSKAQHLTIAQFIERMNIEQKLVEFNVEEDCFNEIA